MNLVVVLFSLFILVKASPHEDTLKFCERYAECNSVALLEERLCLGNTNLRPYWLPDSHDPKGCHAKLKNDYKVIEKMEQDLDGQYLACLTDNAIPMENALKQSCSSRVLRAASRFSFGRTITYVPTNCFTGIDRRRQRECGQLKACCNSVDKCQSLLTDSSVAKALETLRVNMRKRSKDCERGLAVPELPLGDAYPANEDAERSWAPKGNVNVRFNKQGQNQKDGEKKEGFDAERSGFVNVRFTTENDGSKAINDNETTEEKAQRLLFRKGDGFNSHGDGKLGEVSNPIGGPKFTKAEFPKLGESAPNSAEKNLVVNDGALTFGENPNNTLIDFTDSKQLAAPVLRSSAEVRKIDLTSEEIRDDERRRSRLPKNLEEHETQFRKALDNTKEYKGKIEKLSSAATAEMINESVNSLLNAGQVSSGTLGVASGTVEKMSTFGDSDEMDVVAGDNVVTSSPLIMIPKYAGVSSLAAPGCGARAFSAKTLQFEKILSMLGEKRGSDDMREIKELIDAWHNSFRKKVVTAKDLAKNKEIEKALQGLIEHFDDVNLQLIKSQVNATFTSEDYPSEDANITETECDPLPDEKDLVRGKKNIGNSTLTSIEDEDLTNEHGDKVMIEDGVEKIVFAHNTDGNDVTDDGKATSAQPEESSTAWVNEEYKKEIANYRREHRNEGNGTVPRNDTACDMYMRCRTQMHLAVDGCAWRFASGKIMHTLAESAESLLYKDEEPCSPDQQPLYEELYEMMIGRNSKLRKCLDKRNEKFFAESVCIPYDKKEKLEFDASLKRILMADYPEAVSCYRDANRIQQKCTLLRDCCPNFDRCREDELDIPQEQALISMTARINEAKQECIKQKAREAFKLTLRGLLGKGGRETLRQLRSGTVGLDIARGAQLLRRMRK